MTYHPVTKMITDLLEKDGCTFRTFEHEPVRTSEEAMKQRPEFSLHQGAKALIVKVRKPGEPESYFVMLVFPADLKFDSKKVKPMLGVKEVSFATEDEVSKITNGVQVGGVPPFGNLFNLPVFVDEALFENEDIIFNAGDRSFSVTMKAADYKRILEPQIGKFTV